MGGRNETGLSNTLPGRQLLNNRLDMKLPGLVMVDHERPVPFQLQLVLFYGLS